MITFSKTIQLQSHLQVQTKQHLSKLQQVIELEPTQAQEEQDRQLYEPQEITPSSRVVKLPGTTLQIPGDPTAQAILMDAPTVELHLSEVALKRLYQIQEKVLHELSVYHLGLSKEYHNLSIQHFELKQDWDQLQVEKASVEAYKQAITTTIQQLYQRFPKQEAKKEVTEPHDQLQ